MRSLVMILILFTACQSDYSSNQQYAETTTYYFDIVQNFSNQGETSLATEVSKLLENKKYAITNRSGKDWPFFQSYNLNEKVLRADLMVPHTVSHSLINIRQNQCIANNDVRLKIVLNKQGDEFNFDMVIYEREKNDWLKKVDTGNHRISKNKFESKEDLIQVIYETIVRYSFK